jgi:EmrB/QacA subfamily drug resistance transporter
VSTLVDTPPVDLPAADLPAAEAPRQATAPVAVPASEQTGEAGYRWRWLAYSAVVTSSVMDLLDSTVMGVAGPQIQSSLGGSYSSLQWMAAGYTMALAVLLLAGGRLGDLLGRKRAMLIGLGGFTLASLICALAVSPEMLIGSRVIQGAFAAIMLPQGFGIARDLFSPKEIAKAFGLFGPIMGLSAVLGPIVGGGLLDADLFGTGWRGIFLVNVPIGIAAFVIIARFLPSVEPADQKTTLDVTGLVLAGAGLFTLIYPLVQGRELGWPTWMQAMMVCSVPLFGLFGWQQARRKRSGSTPLVELGLFRNRAYVSGVVFAIVFFAALAGTFVLGIFLQIGIGFSPIHASLTMTPWAAGAIFGSAVSGMTMQRFGRRLLHTGLVLMGAGLAGLCLVIDNSGAAVSHWDLLVPNLVGGFGMGMIFVPLFDIILAGVSDREVGSATGLLGSLEQLGLALGVAVIGTIFFEQLSGGQEHRLAAVSGVQYATWATVGLIVLAFAVGFLLPRKARESVGH